MDECFSKGVIPLGLYGNIVLAHRAAIDATKSTGRKKAEEALKNGEMIIRDGWD